MTTQPDTGIDPKLLAQRDDIAQRQTSIAWTRGIISALGAAAGLAVVVALGAYTMVPMALIGGFALGSMLSNYVTMTEQTKLDIDQQTLMRTHAEGKNWWQGYREEVMEKGGQQGPLAAPIFPGASPRPNGLREARS